MTNNLLIYPTIDLFVYQLAEGLGQSDSEIAENRREFWQKFYLNKLDDQQLEERETAISDYIPLLKKEEKSFPYPQDGFFNPVKIGDTYSLQINCSSDKNKVFHPGNLDGLEAHPTGEVSGTGILPVQIWDASDKSENVDPLAPRDINSFQAIKKTIEQKYPTTEISKINFGQSWFVWAKLTSNEQKPETVAKNIYEQLQLFDDLSWEDTLKTDLKLSDQNDFDATFFECWQLPSDRGDTSQNRHLLIALFAPNENNRFFQPINKNYPKLTRLFLSRHKIIWAYQNSRHYKANLKEAAKEVQKRVKDLPNKIDISVNPQKNADLGLLQQELAHTLNLMSGYAETLSYLEEQKNTIEANFKNYQRLVTDLNLPCLQTFTPIVSEKYLPQINSDLTSLSSGLRLLENSVRTIEGIINIEQAKGDRALNENSLNLNKTFLAASAGLATSQVIGAVWIAYDPPTKDLAKSSSIFMSSIASGLIIFWLVRKMLTSKGS